MNPAPFTQFFSILGLLAVASIVVYSFALVLKLKPVTNFFRLIRLELIAAVAVVSMAGSLFFSEVLNFEPCLLCWVQRGFMYPAAILLAAEVVYFNISNKPSGAITKFAKLQSQHLGAIAAIPLSLLGLAVAVFHRYEQAAGSDLSFCDVSVPCSQKWFEEFGFFTIPALAGVGFATILFFGTDLVRDNSSNQTDT